MVSILCSVDIDRFAPNQQPLWPAAVTFARTHEPTAGGCSPLHGLLRMNQCKSFGRLCFFAARAYSKSSFGSKFQRNIEVSIGIDWPISFVYLAGFYLQTSTSGHYFCADAQTAAAYDQYSSLHWSSLFIAGRPIQQRSWYALDLHGKIDTIDQYRFISRLCSLLLIPPSDRHPLFERYLAVSDYLLIMKISQRPLFLRGHMDRQSD